MYKFELLAFVLSFHPYLLSKPIVFKGHHTRSPRVRLSQIVLSAFATAIPSVGHAIVVNNYPVDLFLWSVGSNIKPKQTSIMAATMPNKCVTTLELEAFISKSRMA